MRPGTIVLLCACLLLGSCTRSVDNRYDVVIRGAAIYDGAGTPPFLADIGIRGDTIVSIGSLDRATGLLEVDAGELAAAPGFINMLSWATESLIADGRSQSDLRQGVTLEVFGEGVSMGPLNETMKREMQARQGDIKYDIEWTTLGEYLEYLEKRGVSTNIASFAGATTLRIHELGYEDRAPTADELGRMLELARRAMEEGALGIGSSLIYPPASFARTEELIALCDVAARHGGMYISHIRSEGPGLLESVDELIHIARKTGIAAEIYHLKASGRRHWNKLDAVIGKIEEARREGLKITADMYTYTAGSTGLTASMPPWAQEGGHQALIKRLKDPATRKRVAQEMLLPATSWENLMRESGTPDNVLLVGFRNPALRNLTGKTLAQAAAMRGKSPVETAIDLVVEDDSRVGTIYFMMSEDNVRRQLLLPWVSFGSDAASLAPEGAFLNSNPHPRAYGNFARLLGKYVREERLIPLEEAIRRLTSLPAANLKLERRGELKSGNYADIVLFHPEKIEDMATFETPHKYSLGVEHVFVNGVRVIGDGVHTGAKPGRVVRGPGWTGRKAN